MKVLLPKLEHTQLVTTGKAVSAMVYGAFQLPWQPIKIAHQDSFINLDSSYLDKNFYQINVQIIRLAQLIG